MQVIDATEMARIEKLAIDEGASSENFMDEASRNMAHCLLALAEQK